MNEGQKKDIYKKLLSIREKVPYLQKEAKGGMYAYVSSSQVLGNIRKLMDEEGLLLVPEIIESKVSEKSEEKSGGKVTVTYFTELVMKMTWVDTDNPLVEKGRISCQWYGQGIDIAGEKGVGKALTYAEKYFLLKFFNIATDKDDPDAFQKGIDGDTSKPPAPPASGKKDDRPVGKIDDAKDVIKTANTAQELENIATHLRQYRWTQEHGEIIKTELEAKYAELEAQNQSGGS